MTWSRLSIGVLAGLLATIPMTLVMLIWHRLLPVHERQPLPPEQMTFGIVEEAGAADELDRDDRRILAWLLHFGFGAATGVLYVGVADRLTRPAPATGIVFGILVWGVVPGALAQALPRLSDGRQRPAFTAWFGH